MARRARSASRARFLLVLGFAAALAGPARAATTEARDFEVLINGRAAGTSRITIVQEDDGSTYMQASGNVAYRQGLFSFTFTVEAKEWWKDGRLVALKSDSTENKKHTVVDVSASADGQLQLRVNNQTRSLSKDAWTSSFWKLADPRFHNRTVPVLEVDTGKDFSCHLEFVANEQIQVMGRLEKCFRFRVTGMASPTDLWFDEHHRLVRQEFTESGQRMIVQLVGKR